MNRGSDEKRQPVLELGPDVIHHLLPHRRPLLFVDSVRAYDRGASKRTPSRFGRARQISANEEVFAGHFPGLSLWPGIYTIEGLGQSCFLLEVLWALQKEWQDEGGDPEEILSALKNLELGYQLSPRFRPAGFGAAPAFRWQGPAHRHQRLGRESVSCSRSSPGSASTTTSFAPTLSIHSYASRWRRASKVAPWLGA